MNNKKFFKNKSGFTLLETLVAIMLFVIALSALLALVRDSVTSATYTKNDVVATYLAQEGIDYIRNVRDEMVHVNPTAQPWTDFTTFIMSTSSCSTGCELNVYNATKLGPYANTPIFAKFTRKITTSMPGLGSPAVYDTLLVKVEVSWKNGTTLMTKTLTTSLYNWAL